MDNEEIKNDERKLWAWWNPAVTPLVKAIYRKDVPLGTALIASFRESLEESGLDPDLRQAASYKFSFVSNQFYRITGTKSRQQALADTITGLNEPSRGQVSAAIRAQLLIQAQTIAECIGEDGLPEDEFRSLYEDAAQAVRPAEFWHYVTSWGFLHDRIEFVKTALAELTVNSDGYQSDLVWQRANLIHLLMEGRAKERDVVELIKRLDNAVQWESIRRLVWPAIEQAGLHNSPLVQAALERKQRQFDERPDEVPRRDVPTKGIAKRSGPVMDHANPPSDAPSCCP